MAEEKKMIDLSKVEIKEIDGTVNKVDMSKDVASQIYPKAQTLPVVNACLDLYKEGKCEYNDEMAEAIKALLDNNQVGYVVKTAVVACL